MRKFIILGLTALSLFVTGLAGAVPARALQLIDNWDFQSGDTHVQHGAGVDGSDIVGIGHLFGK